MEEWRLENNGKFDINTKPYEQIYMFEELTNATPF